MVRAGLLARIEREAEGAFSICRTVKDIRSAFATGSFAGVMHLEGAEAITADLDLLYALYNMGLRTLGPVWSRPNIFAFGVPFRYPSSPDIGPGLSSYGKALVRSCNELGIMIDLSHLNEAGFWDVANLSDAPLVVSHSNVHAICSHSRNATDRQLDVRVQLPKVHRSKIEDVARIQVGVVGEVPVTLGAVASLAPAIGPAEIRRMDGRRGLRIRARLDSSNLAGVASEVKVVLDEHATDPKVTAEIAGQAQEMGSSLDSLLFTGLISLFLIYVVMASSFESLHHPFLIMLTVPLSIVGVIVACVVTQTPISAMVGIGAIILGGIVVNNAIVLINTVNHRRGLGMDVEEALVTAGHLRVRPILMTTATTVLGLLPMALGFGDGAALRQPLAIAVIGGLTLATALTLLVIPCCYLLMPGRKRDAWANQIE